MSRQSDYMPKITTMDAYDELKLKGREEFAEYRYYKGEDECPYPSQSAENRWWMFEKNYLDNYKKTGKWKEFKDFFDHWVTEIAAPGSGYDLSRGNWWKKEYESNSPYSTSI